MIFNFLYLARINREHSLKCNGKNLNITFRYDYLMVCLEATIGENIPAYGFT
jgi:hypothetical protein